MDDLTLMVKALEGLETEYERDAGWEHSPYKWILGQPSGTKGAIARRLVALWAAGSSKMLTQSTIDGQILLHDSASKYQIKFSTMWGTGSYRFQQFRKGTYDHMILFGLAPRDMNIWIVPREAIATHIVGSNGQHTGSGAAETDWFEVDPSDVPEWLQDWGGTLTNARRVLDNIP